MARRTQVIEVIEAEPPQRGGLFGRIQRLRDQKMFDAQALARTLEILDEDLRRDALASMGTKMQQALSARSGNGHARELPPKPKPAKQKKEPAPIHGPRLTLFLLEHLDNEKTRPYTELLDLLAQAGSPVRDKRGIAAALAGNLAGRYGYVKRMADGNWRRTSAGARYAVELRADLIAKGKLGDNYREPVAA